jgi:hypothetical protein
MAIAIVLPKTQQIYDNSSKSRPHAMNSQVPPLSALEPGTATIASAQACILQTGDHYMPVATDLLKQGICTAAAAATNCRLLRRPLTRSTVDDQNNRVQVRH